MAHFECLNPFWPFCQSLLGKMSTVKDINFIVNVVSIPSLAQGMTKFGDCTLGVGGIGCVCFLSLGPFSHDRSNNFFNSLAFF